MTLSNGNEASIVCAVVSGAVMPSPMDNEPWQRRAKRAGLSQKDLARFLGVAPNTVSRQLRGELEIRPYTVNFIRAWERLSPRDRDELWALIETTEDETSAAYKLQKPDA